MRRTYLMLSAVGAILMLAGTQLLAIDPDATASRAQLPFEHNVLPFPMPQDRSMPVISMSFADPRAASAPAVADLSIFADGRVTATVESESRRLVSAQLPRSEWLKVQKVLFVENHLLDCQADELSDAISSLRRQRRRPSPGPEAAVTIFQVRGEDFSHEVICHAVGLTATQLPDMHEIQALYACQQCLQNVIHVVRAGGYEQVHRTLQTVNTRLERQIPGCGPLSPDDLRLVDAAPDGTRYLQFSRMPCASNGRRDNVGGLQTDDRYLMVSVYERPGRPLEISIIGESSAQ